MFEVGQTVTHKYRGLRGEITATVPGNGTFRWYFVIWEGTSTEERHTANELE